MKLKSFFLFLFFFVCSFSFADYNRMGVPDSSDIRHDINETWLNLPLDYLREKHTEIRMNSVGEKFQVRLEETATTFSVYVCPEISVPVDVYTNEGFSSAMISDYASSGSGSWVLVRNKKDGSPLYIRCYFLQDSDVYVQFSPKGTKTLADYVIGGFYAAHSVPIGISFERLYTASFEEILSVTEKSLPWQYASIFTGQYSGTFHMISVIKKNLSRILTVPDGAYDENGSPIFIKDGSKRPVLDSEVENRNLTLSSAGFLKWVVDGLIEPISGSCTYLAPLLRPTYSVSPLGYAAKVGEKNNLAFTLDFTRNLAAARLSVQMKTNYLYEDSGVDVNIEPFSSTISDGGVVNIAGYVSNTGYDIQALRPILYVLGVSNPTYFYLAAVRRQIPGKPGKNPEVYTFDQCAAVFPYFDKNGRFGCTVFENGAEMSLDSFMRKYEGCYVHLTRVLTSDKFYPQ
ncbi:MAG: hypothetical protein IJP61_00455 [Treponema sp.]|nr:hypothetical protein [Treponema sp.]